MPILDLRSEAPPLGYRAEQVPLLDISTFDAEPNRVVDPDGAGFAVFWLPDHPAFILRQQALYEDLGQGNLRSTNDLRKFVERGNQHFQLLEGMGIHIPPHRHIEALLPVDSTANQNGEGWLFSIAERLSPGFEVMDPTNETHLPGCLTILKALHTYAKAQLAENADMLIDVYEAEQYSYNTVTGAVALHDTDIELRDTSGLISVGYHRLGVSMDDLTCFANSAVQTAQGTSYEEPLTVLRQHIASDLPEPRKDPWKG